MPAKATATTDSTAQGAWRQAAVDYLQQSRRPLVSLAFVLPLLTAYEGGVILLGPRAVRNGADVWLRQLLDQFGFGQYFLLPALTVLLLLAWHHMTRERWKLPYDVLHVMFAECAVLGLLLVGIARAQALVAERALPGGEGVVAIPVAAAWLLAGRTALAGRALGFVGAGVYEEVLFRLLLLPGVAAFAQRLGVRHAWGTASAVVLTSVLFSAAHYVGAHGETFQVFSFSFRFLAGVFFALVFVYRGFGIAAGTHALYDIFVGIG